MRSDRGKYDAHVYGALLPANTPVAVFTCDLWKALTGSPQWQSWAWPPAVTNNSVNIANHQCIYRAFEARCQGSSGVSH
ncbi:hypothetical protein TcWFU_000551 [Taenia crassiceps]|uniref:Uncharacterized protein n=1 Tax=Taenia crassiceps TaxID=6207 RepID=A0ABR4QKU0_9CEST